MELPEGALPVYRAESTAKHHPGLVRKRGRRAYDQAEARRIAERPIRKKAAAKNRPADLINIALEKVVKAGLERPGFSTFDKMDRTDNSTLPVRGDRGLRAPRERVRVGGVHRRARRR
ncbi:hypothetical protein [Streptomyces sp. NPDC050428]|uniref:hypothetical protein n=1 Tax=Streptomyces sp. NPDC050428 TaxID=3155757 RepID=UPI00344194F9